MGFTLDIPAEYAALYGVRAEAFNIAPNNRSSLGSSLYGRDRNNAWQFMPVVLGEIEMWAPIVRLTARKTVIETQLVERSGSVKEIISLDDYVINLRGIIKLPDNSWPDAEIKVLNELWVKKEAVGIKCALTDIFLNGNEHVVITNLSIPEKRGQAVVLYEMEMVSDIAFELEINE